MCVSKKKSVNIVQDRICQGVFRPNKYGRGIDNDWLMCIQQVKGTYSDIETRGIDGYVSELCNMGQIGKHMCLCISTDNAILIVQYNHVEQRSGSTPHFFLDFF